MRMLTVGSSGLLVEVDDLEAASALFNAITAARDEGHGPLRAVREVVPAARTVLLRFDALRTSAADIAGVLRGLDTRSERTTPVRTVRIPVVYNGEDLKDVADLLGISTQQVIERHAAHPWRAAFVGFAPGFAYLVGGDPIFDVPRRATPRLTVPAGAVGLAGTFSGVYPRQSSGGWQLIGVTSVAMWDERRDPPASVRPGDIVQFEALRDRVSAAGARPVAGMGDCPASPSGNVGHLEDEATPAHAEVLSVERTGMMALFEDDGRHASPMGVTGSGSADPLSAHTANQLVGNAADEAVIEITGGGARFTAVEDVVLAVAGAKAPITIQGRDGARTAIRRQEPFVLMRGERLDIGLPDSGLREYLAMQGGYAVAKVLGSASTDTMAHIGPQPLAAGDVLAAAGHAHGTVAQAQPWPSLPSSGEVAWLDVVLGPRDDWFTPKGIDDLLTQTWRVTAQSNRVGLRLHGDLSLERRETKELASEGTVPGAIQVPADGQPVLFLCDQPVTGGYPVIAVLTRGSRRVAGQLPIDALIRFRAAPGDAVEVSDRTREGCKA